MKHQSKSGTQNSSRYSSLLTLATDTENFLFTNSEPGRLRREFDRLANAPGLRLRSTSRMTPFQFVREPLEPGSRRFGHRLGSDLPRNGCFVHPKVTSRERRGYHSYGFRHR